MEKFTYVDLGSGKVFVEEIGSPIEEIMYKCLLEKGEEFKNKYKLDRLDIEPQLPVITNDGKTYKVDISIYILKCNGLTLYDGISNGYFIECDGHEFHEKTKEQARNDKERERELLGHCRKVIRFTGSEIYKDVNKCCDEVFEIISHDLRLESLCKTNIKDGTAGLRQRELISILGIIERNNLDITDDEKKIIKRVKGINLIK